MMETNLEDTWDFAFSNMRRHFWDCRGTLDFRFEFDGEGMNFNDNGSVISRVESALDGLQKPEIWSNNDTELHISSTSPVYAAFYIPLPTQNAEVKERDLFKTAMHKVRRCLETEFSET